MLAQHPHRRRNSFSSAPRVQLSRGNSNPHRFQKVEACRCSRRFLVYPLEVFVRQLVALCHEHPCFTKSLKEVWAGQICKHRIVLKRSPSTSRADRFLAMLPCDTSAHPSGPVSRTYRRYRLLLYCQLLELQVEHLSDHHHQTQETHLFLPDPRRCQDYVHHRLLEWLAAAETIVVAAE